MNQNLSLIFRLEILLLTLLGWLVIYFFVNRLNVNPNNRLDLRTTIDNKIPFIPQFALVYFSTYVFVLQPFLILSESTLFYWMLISFVSISVIASLIHAVLPSKIDRRENLDTNNLSGWMLGLFQKTCKPYGNFPSMHVGLCVPVVATNYLAGGSVLGSISLIWAVLIALSTLYTKQHYILDVLAGFLSGITIFSLTYWFFFV